MRKPLLFKLPAWYALAAVFLLSAIIYSCKKDQHLTQNTLTPETAAAKMQSWLAQQKTDSLSGITITNLLNNADWKTAHTLTADTGRVYLTVKLNYLPTFDDPDKTEDRYLTLLVQNGNTTGYIYDLYGNKTDIAGKGDDAITLFNQNNMPGFTGEVTVSSWKNVVKELKVFTNGAMVSYGKVTPQASNKTIQSNVKVNGCDDYYWLVKDGTGRILAAYYLFTVCDSPGGGSPCDQQPYAFRGSKGTLTVRTNCGGGSGGPAAPPPQHEITKDPCKEVKLLNVRAANAVVSNQTNYAYSNMQESGGKEFGANITLNSLQGGDSYVNSPVTIGTDTTWTPSPFTWDNNHGFTIGYTHVHPNGTAPSPTDIKDILDPINLGSPVLAAGQDAINFYKDVAHVTSQTSTGNYTITIANWNDASNVFTGYSMSSLDLFYKRYFGDYNSQNPDFGYGEASAYALNKIFGDSINMYYQHGSTYVAIMIIDDPKHGLSISEIPCAP